MLTKDFPTYVITDKGIRSMKDILPGDHVYNYFSGEPMEVAEVVKLPAGDMYRVGYSDGRICGFHEEQRVMYETCIDMDGCHISYAKPEYIPKDKNIQNSIIDRFRVELKSPYVYPSPTADPYVAGPFLVYGNFDDPYINLPTALVDNVSAAQNILEYLKCRYAMVDNIMISSDKIYFMTADMKYITWDMLLGDIGMEQLTTGTDQSSSIISNYLYASTNDKLQFIRGIFDIGFSKQLSADHVAIRGVDFPRMSEVRNILSSLGVVSRIVFDQYLLVTSSMSITMYILNGNIPELFYNREDIAEFINASVNPNFNNPVDISVVSAVNMSSKGKGQIKYPAYDIILSGSNRNKCYLSGNMIPRLSI